MKFLLRLLIIFLFFSCELDPVYHTLTLSSFPTEGGKLSPVNGGEYEANSEITLQATSNSDFEFDSWSGSLSGSQNPIVIIMDKDKTIVANFKLKDTDGDGVSDAEDQCDNTPEGASVDNNGCILPPNQSSVSFNNYSTSISTINGEKTATFGFTIKNNYSLPIDVNEIRVYINGNSNPTTIYRVGNIFGEYVGKESKSFSLNPIKYNSNVTIVLHWSYNNLNFTNTFTKN